MKKKQKKKWLGWAVAHRGELRYVSVDREFKPVLPMAKDGFHRYKVKIVEE